MKAILIIIFCVTIVFSSGLYNETYFVNSNKVQNENKINTNLMYGDFDKVIRFNPIFFNPSTNEITKKSQNYLEEIANVYEKYKDREIIISIIGYTDSVQTKTEKVNQSSWFRTYDNNLSEQSSQVISIKYASYVNDELVNKDIPQEVMLIEQRAGQDNLYARATEEGRAKNFRAMVSMYISKDKNSDSDNDGIFDSEDKCSFTPKGHNVDVNGCSKILNLTIKYNENAYNISDKSFEKLASIVTFMNKYQEFKVLLYGHSSNEGSKLNNQILSEKRALSIRKYLISHKIQFSRISVYGRAATEPIFSNKTKEGRAQNRRVEITLY